MFDQLVVSGPQGVKTSKPWTVTLSALIQVAILGILILIPLIYTEALDPRLAAMSLVAPPPPPPPPPPPAIVKTVKAPRVVQLNRMVAPTVIPKTVSIVKDDAPVIYSNSAAGVDGGTGSLLGGILGNAAPPPPKPAAPQRVQVGGHVEAGLLTNKVQPEYPQLAKIAHVSGTVVLHAFISKEGTIESIELISGNALLVPAAMNAVKQWRYKPYLLNGDPVGVETTINVDFSFGG